MPVVVTENGIGTDDDAQRVSYNREAHSALARCLEAGVDVRGYSAWSLLDDYEWIHGYKSRFRLISVDRESARIVVAHRADGVGSATCSAQT